jgi:hypothetical protein
MSETMRLRCRINGRDLDREIDPRRLLVELVPDVAGLKGTRIGCLTGDCGACTLRLDGNVVKSCLVLALSAEGVTYDLCNMLSPLRAWPQGFMNARVGPRSRVGRSKLRLPRGEPGVPMQRALPPSQRD